MSKRYESGFVAPPTDYEGMKTEIGVRIATIMDLYGDANKQEEYVTWSSTDGAAEVYELRVKKSLKNANATYRFFSRNAGEDKNFLYKINRTHSLLSADLRHDKQMPRSREPYRQAIGEVLRILNTYDFPEPRDVMHGVTNEPISVHDEFEGIVAHAVDHTSFESAPDNPRFPSLYQFFQRQNRKKNIKEWRVNPAMLHNETISQNEDDAID